MAEWTENLFTGLAEYLHGLGLGAYRPDSVPDAGEVAIVIGWSPPAPDRLIVLTPYQPGGGDSGTDTVQHLQVRCRGVADAGPFSALAIRDGVYDALHGLAWVHLGGVRIQQIRHQSGSALGPDANGRHETTDNFRAQAVRTSALRTE